uniref:(California timema) hypothetical protein n=1 Tax=Timema californicum TaxID=61474 RepID=A0A7R9JAH8_TIMCA|nr:unnamed protein product [Timema californicum]
MYYLTYISSKTSTPLTLSPTLKVFSLELSSEESSSKLMKILSDTSSVLRSDFKYSLNVCITHLPLKPLFPGTNEVDMVSKIHNLLGSPHPHVIAKFRRHKSPNWDCHFPIRAGTGLTCLLANVSEAGREILQQMLIYDPDTRAHSRRLLEHRYFNDLRELEKSPRHRCWATNTSTQPPQLRRNPALTSVSLADRRKRVKRTKKVSEEPPRDVGATLTHPILRPVPLTNHVLHIPCPRKPVKRHISDKQREPEKTWGTRMDTPPAKVRSSKPLKLVPIQREVYQPTERVHLPNLAEDRHQLPRRNHDDTSIGDRQSYRPSLGYGLGYRPVRQLRGPSTIPSLPTIEPHVCSKKTTISASFLKLPPISDKRPEPFGAKCPPFPRIDSSRTVDASSLNPDHVKSCNIPMHRILNPMPPSKLIPKKPVHHILNHCHHLK